MTEEDAQRQKQLKDFVKSGKSHITVSIKGAKVDIVRDGSKVTVSTETAAGRIEATGSLAKGATEKFVRLEGLKAKSESARLKIKSFPSAIQYGVRDNGKTAYRLDTPLDVSAKVGPFSVPITVPAKIPYYVD